MQPTSLGYQVSLSLKNIIKKTSLHQSKPVTVYAYNNRLHQYALPKFVLVHVLGAHNDQINTSALEYKKQHGFYKGKLSQCKIFIIF